MKYDCDIVGVFLAGIDRVLYILVMFGLFEKFSVRGLVEDGNIPRINRGRPVC
jgi:hypothetical protein